MEIPRPKAFPDCFNPFVFHRIPKYAQSCIDKMNSPNCGREQTRGSAGLIRMLSIVFSREH